jgi:alpha-L-fucosidase
VTLRWRTLLGRNPNYDVKKEPQRWQRFVDFTQGQINELVTDYGDIDVLWFDSGWVQKGKGLDLEMDKIAVNARKKQPGLLIVDRTVHGKNENYLTPEQVIPKNHLPFPWETCMTSSKKWSWNYKDTYKSKDLILHQLVHVVAMGGNYLLNAAPDQYGEFDQRAKKLFKEIGQWMDINGEAIYKTGPCAPYKQGQWRFTASKNLKRVNAFYLIKEGEKCPSELILDLPKKHFSKIKILGFKEKVDFTFQVNDKIHLSLTEKMRNQVDSAFTVSFFYDDLDF